MRYLIVFLCVFYSLKGFSFEELQTYKDLKLSSDQKKTWVIFDIDNTLIRPKEEIGSHQWADYMADRYLKNGHTKEESSTYQNQIFLRAQKFVNPTIVDSSIFEFLNQLDESGIEFLALTARNAFTLKETTITQLKRVNLLGRLNNSHPEFNTDLKFSEYMQQGVVFSNGLSKGDILKLLLSKAKMKPEKIIFIDDKEYNVKSVEKAAVELGIDLTAYRFSYADEVVSNFNAKLADKEWFAVKYLGSINYSTILNYPKEMAKALMNNIYNSKSSRCVEYNSTLIFSCEILDREQKFKFENFEDKGFFIEETWDLF